MPPQLTTTCEQCGTDFTYEANFGGAPDYCDDCAGVDHIDRGL